MTARAVAYRKELRARTDAEMPEPPETQRCSSCEQWLPAADFHQERGRPNGLTSRCRPCKRDSQLQTKYGITQADWDAMFEAQGRACALCRCTEPMINEHWHTDHCHLTGRVRSILCPPCNLVVGCSEKGWLVPSSEAILAYLRQAN